MTASRARRNFQRAETYLSAGHVDAATGALQAVLAEMPGHVPALLKLSALHLMAGACTPANQLTLHATRQTIDSPGLALQLIGQLVALGQSTLVLDICSQLPPPMWDSPQNLAAVAQQLSRVGAHRMARAYARAAVDKDPRHPPSLYMAAHIEVFFGEVDAAADLLERALHLYPDLSDAHWLLSRLRRPDPAARIDRIERALARAAQTEDQAFIAYALHNELHDLGDFKRAFVALERACRAKRAGLDYDAGATRNVFTRLQQWSAAELSADGSEDRQLTPIFIVGLHRSGTTLVERIIGGHSQVSAAGETYELPTQLRLASGRYSSSVVDEHMVAARQSLNYRHIGDGYLAGMRWRARERPWVTDKLPSNFFNIGFIARALPHARFIHVSRDPIDTGLSSLRTLFSTACPYSYDQQEFVSYHGWQRELMAHWRALLPERILELTYEDVVANPLAAAQRMSEFCGLPFEPGMIDIERSSDPVATASSVLVRDGIRRDRGRLWQSYAEQLKPLIDAFA